MKKILFVDACVRKESRTKQLAEHLLSQLEGTIAEVNLERENLRPLDGNTLLRRDHLIEKKAYSDPMFRNARLLAEADTVVIAAPFWDLSFPASLKTYCEHTMVSGLTFDYEGDDPVGCCKAAELYYITTAGGPIFLRSRVLDTSGIWQEYSGVSQHRFCLKRKAWICLGLM